MSTVKDIKKYYNRIYRSKEDGAMNPYKYYPYFIELLDVQKGKKLLDIACGIGFLLKAAEKKSLNTYGIDISSAAVKVAKTIAKKSVIKIGRGEKIPFKANYFDYITCLGSLEHFLNIPKGIKEMIRVSKKDAKFCIVVPNINYFGWFFKFNKGTRQRKLKEKLLNLKQWKELLKRNGLITKKSIQDKWFMKEINIFENPNPLGIIFRSTRLLIWKLLPLHFTYQFIFICEK